MSGVAAAFAGDFTNRYAPYLNPWPEVNSFREYLKFVPTGDRSGLQYTRPIQAALSHGQTTDLTGGTFALNIPRPGVELIATLDGTDLIIRDTFPYSAMLKARNGVSLQGDAAAYWDPLDKVMMTVMRGMEHYAELMLMYGPGTGSTALCDIGVIATNAVVSGGPNWNSGTAPVVQITQASWAAGIWNNSGSGGQATSGMLVDVWNSGMTAVVANNIQVQGIVDASLCRVQFAATSASGTFPGTTVGAATAPTAGQRFTPAGWGATTSLGVEGILRNTGSFAGISAALNPFWRSRIVTVGGPISSDLFIQQTSRLMPNGGNGKMTGWCGAGVFADIVRGTIGNTRWNNSMGDNKVKMQGADVLQFMTATGVVTLKKHEYMKQGQMWIMMDDEAVRIGASDITFRGANGNEGFFLELSNNAGSEIRAICQQAAFLDVPFHNMLLDGITPFTAGTWDTPT